MGCSLQCRAAMSLPTGLLVFIESLGHIELGILPNRTRKRDPYARPGFLENTWGKRQRSEVAATPKYKTAKGKI